MKLWQWVVVVAAVILAMATAANASDCLPGTTKHPYAGPDKDAVWVDQPVGEPLWAYLRLIAPDGQTWDHPNPPLHGSFTSTVAGQWYVCFTQDARPWLNTTGTTSTTTTPDTGTHTSTTASVTTIAPTTTTATTEPRYSTIKPIPDRPGWYITQSGHFLT